MKVLVACEFSGVVRDAFTKAGHYAVSCDFLPSDTSGKHCTGDINNMLDLHWDLMLAFPPCTHLAVSGAKWFKQKRESGVQQKALKFVRLLMEAPIDKICIENPISIISTQIRKPDQIIQPWMFGHPEKKSTCLWLKELPKLMATNNVKEEMEKLPKNKQQRIHYLPPSKDRTKERSRTFTGIADAMAEQWG